MSDVTMKASARFSNLVAPERDEAWTLANTVYPGFDSYQQFTERRIPVAVLERRDAT